MFGKPPFIKLLLPFITFLNCKDSYLVEEFFSQPFPISDIALTPLGCNCAVAAMHFFKSQSEEENSPETPVNFRYFHADVENRVRLEPIPLQRGQDENRSFYWEQFEHEVFLFRKWQDQTIQYIIVQTPVSKLKDFLIKDD